MIASCTSWRIHPQVWAKEDAYRSREESTIKPPAGVRRRSRRHRHNSRGGRSRRADRPALRGARLAAVCGLAVNRGCLPAAALGGAGRSRRGRRPRPDRRPVSTDGMGTVDDDRAEDARSAVPATCVTAPKNNFAISQRLPGSSRLAASLLGLQNGVVPRHLQTPTNAINVVRDRPRSAGFRLVLDDPTRAFGGRDPRLVRRYG